MGERKAWVPPFPHGRSLPLLPCARREWNIYLHIWSRTNCSGEIRRLPEAVGSAVLVPSISRGWRERGGAKDGPSCQEQSTRHRAAGHPSPKKHWFMGTWMSVWRKSGSMDGPSVQSCCSIDRSIPFCCICPFLRQQKFPCSPCCLLLPLAVHTREAFC